MEKNVKIEQTEEFISPFRKEICLWDVCSNDGNVECYSKCNFLTSVLLMPLLSQQVEQRA